MLALTRAPTADPMLTHPRNTRFLLRTCVEAKLHLGKECEEGVGLDQHAQVRTTGPCIRVVSTRLPTIYGVFDLIGFERAKAGTTESETAFVITCGDLQSRVPLLRMHSQCFTGEVLGSSSL